MPDPNTKLTAALAKHVASHNATLMTNPIRPTDDDARELAASLIQTARHAALGVIEPATQSPMVTRIAIAWLGAPHILISELSQHTKALAQNPACSVLIGEPLSKGDPLTHPRLTLQCQAEAADKTTLRSDWLALHPKSKLYYDFTDFVMLRLTVSDAHLNGGFGKAFHLKPDDLPT